MNAARLAALLIAAGLHAGVFYAILAGPFHESFSLAEGEGSDEMTVVATVSLEGTDLFTQAAQEASVAAQAVKAEVEPPKEEEKEKEPEKPKEEPQEPEPPKEEEPQPQVEAEKTPPREEEPVEEKPKQTPQTPTVATQAQDEQVASAASAAQKSKLWSAYKMDLYTTLERFKKKPNARLKGNVVLSVTIAPNGELVKRSVVKSSGRPELDEIALASVDRAAPFSPIPPEVSKTPLTLIVPFEYRVR